MENKQSLSKKKLLSIQEEGLIREIAYDSLGAIRPRSTKKPLLLGNGFKTANLFMTYHAVCHHVNSKYLLPTDLEILKKNPTRRQESQRVLVSIKPRSPAIRTLYITEKTRFCAKKVSDKSGSRLAIGDHSSFTTHFSGDDSGTVNSSECCIEEEEAKQAISVSSVVSDHAVTSTTITQCSQCTNLQDNNFYNEKKRSAEKCYLCTQPQITMNLPKTEIKSDTVRIKANKVDVGTLYAKASTENIPGVPTTPTTLIVNQLSQRLNRLERRLQRQEMVFRCIDPEIPLPSSDDNSNEHVMRSSSMTTRPGCSYIENYSHIPETSAFQRYTHHTSPLPSKVTTIQKEHNSEQYGRDFTAYDGITARGRRQSASVPLKRNEAPKMAAERVHKIRHKLNPVRDYRLMDTVHYLAQGEFAPRDDGIKLTPSREAVLSDIIWEDVCRTHWPHARLGRRNAHNERSTRYELQRLIDNLLRERVAHVERRRRRHYRIVKLNHRHESCRPLGKTGDIIVASHKNRHSDENEGHASEHNAASAIMSDRREQSSSRKMHRSHDMLPEVRDRRRYRQEECLPGPSSGSSRPREPTCCYRTTNPSKTIRSIPKSSAHSVKIPKTGSSASTTNSKSPRLIVKKEPSHRRHTQKEEPDLEHYILLPTLVVRTPSNVRRQKKFNELYHRILNVHVNTDNELTCDVGAETSEDKENTTTKDIGINFNITLSDRDEEQA